MALWGAGRKCIFQTIPEVAKSLPSLRKPRDIGDEPGYVVAEESVSKMHFYHFIIVSRRKCQIFFITTQSCIVLTAKIVTVILRLFKEAVRAGGSEGICF